MRSWRRSPRRGSRASRSSRTICCRSTARRRMCARMVADLGLTTITFQPFRDFEGMPEPARTKVFSRAERKFDLMQELGCDLLLVCSNVSPDAHRRHRPRRRRLPRTWRAGPSARAARGLRGAGLGQARQRLPRRVGGGPPRRPSGHRARARYLPRPGAGHRPELDPLHPQGSHLPGAGRRRAAARHGLPLLEPALSLHAGAGRACHR